MTRSRFAQYPARPPERSPTRVAASPMPRGRAPSPDSRTRVTKVMCCPAAGGASMVKIIQTTGSRSTRWFSPHARSLDRSGLLSGPHRGHTTSPGEATTGHAKQPPTQARDTDRTTSHGLQAGGHDPERCVPTAYPRDRTPAARLERSGPSDLRHRLDRMPANGSDETTDQKVGVRVPPSALSKSRQSDKHSLETRSNHLLAIR
jgi:hypothetical protein